MVNSFHTLWQIADNQTKSFYEQKSYRQHYVSVFGGDD